jgi:parvulin-like peptidyl-prolyl isomerase
MRNSKKITLGFIWLCLVSGCSEKTEPPAGETVAIRVDNLVLTLNEFNGFFETFERGFEKEDDQDDTAIRETRLGFLLQLVEEMIILRRADELSLEISPQELDAAVRDFKKDYPGEAFEDMLLRQAVPFETWKERLKRRLLVEKVIRKDVLKENAAAPEEIREYYEKHRNEWGHEEQVRARHILLPGADEANSVLERLQKGQDFAAEARLHSTAPDAVNGGDMGYVARGQLPDSLEKLLFDLKPGDLSSVIKTPYGFHIFLVVEKREKGVPSMEACIEKITKGMQNERLEAAYGPWLVQLRERYDIEVNKEII